MIGLLALPLGACVEYDTANNAGLAKIVIH